MTFFCYRYFPKVYNLTFQLRIDLQSNSNLINLINVVTSHKRNWDWRVIGSYIQQLDWLRLNSGGREQSFKFFCRDNVKVGYTLLGLLSKQIVKRLCMYSKCLNGFSSRVSNEQKNNKIFFLFYFFRMEETLHKNEERH